MKYLIPVLILLAGCTELIPGEKMHQAITDCEPNGGVKSFKQAGESASLIVYCENGARFYYR